MMRAVRMPHGQGRYTSWVIQARGSATVTLSIGVLIPTHRRPDRLALCLEALSGQTRPPDEVVVVGRRDDAPSLGVAARWARLAPFPVLVRAIEESSQQGALRAGLGVGTADVIAVTDDDAVPAPSWLQRLEGHYHRHGVGGVGGRDVVHTSAGPISASARRVGTITWWGRLIGNHHLGLGSARDVDVLKGVNMSLRRELWVLDAGLRNRGTLPSWEVAVCLRARSLGWSLVYDPEAIVDHYPGLREQGDERHADVPDALGDEAFNETRAVVPWMPWPRSWAVTGYQLLVGSSRLPGVLAGLVRVVRGEPVGGVARTVQAVIAGRLAALPRAGRFP